MGFTERIIFLHIFWVFKIRSMFLLETITEENEECSNEIEQTKKTKRMMYKNKNKSQYESFISSINYKYEQMYIENQNYQKCIKVLDESFENVMKSVNFYNLWIIKETEILYESFSENIKTKNQDAVFEQIQNIDRIFLSRKQELRKDIANLTRLYQEFHNLYILINKKNIKFGAELALKVCSNDKIIREDSKKNKKN
ncbi:hypothetical protein EDEG_02293 [Edhazardia aedis USNM 41457]|uniref:Uncharacterized protein n=1 Tax=Edhazardia aedis (strain USNM 41457) TaxID=1003232 RepID=J9D6D2_EDHAE|nr:hypothetical protein EDEG_02293 [Edhazardia aedis USNM 41457]|eukprot:EJW03361.1 hypothetical protein EDEG_02293 [Edhazardia aedis USNM 41457]